MHQHVRKLTFFQSNDVAGSRMNPFKLYCNASSKHVPQNFFRWSMIAIVVTPRISRTSNTYRSLKDPWHRSLSNYVHTGPLKVSQCPSCREATKYYFCQSRLKVILSGQLKIEVEFKKKRWYNHLTCQIWIWEMLKCQAESMLPSSRSPSLSHSPCLTKHFAVKATNKWLLPRLPTNCDDNTNQEGSVGAMLSKTSQLQCHLTRQCSKNWDVISRHRHSPSTQVHHNYILKPQTLVLAAQRCTS